MNTANKYNMETLYQIVFPGGAGGNFIHQLLLMLLDGKAKDISITENSGAHLHEHDYLCNIDGEYYEHHAHQDSAYKYITPDHEFKYGIILDHCVPDWDHLFQTIPNTEVICITIPDSKLVPRISGNLYFKTIYNQPPETCPGWLAIKDSEEFSGYASPKDVPNHVLEENFNSIAELYSTIYSSHNGENRSSDERVHYISYRDILYNPSIVLDTLAKATKKELPVGIQDSYQQYLDAQHKLVAEKMPWITD